MQSSSKLQICQNYRHSTSQLSLQPGYFPSLPIFPHVNFSLTVLFFSQVPLFKRSSFSCLHLPPQPIRSHFSTFSSFCFPCLPNWFPLQYTCKRYSLPPYRNLASLSICSRIFGIGKLLAPLCRRPISLAVLSVLFEPSSSHRSWRLFQSFAILSCTRLLSFIDFAISMTGSIEMVETVLLCSLQDANHETMEIQQRQTVPFYWPT